MRKCTEVADAISTAEFVKRYVTGRSNSMFAADIEANKDLLRQEVEGRSVLVIGGAGSIGSSFIKAILRYSPAELVVIDLNENGLTELTRDLRSGDFDMPTSYLTYTLDFADEIFEQIFTAHGGFDIVANFAAHKHVRSEKDKYSVEALIKNNVLKAESLMELLAKNPPRHFFCVSTDKAANPVSVMGASKRVMEDLVMAYKSDFKVTTARFANVAFSNGSLPAGFTERLGKLQPLAAPTDVKRYFVSMEESGQICMLACLLGKSGEVYFPKLGPETMKAFDEICDAYLEWLGYKVHRCESEEAAKKYAAANLPGPEYPVYYFRSNTSGEKDSEEFTVEGEQTDVARYKSLGVITQTENGDKSTIGELTMRLREIFRNPEFTKEEVICALSEYLPTFKHKETGRNLDQRM